MDVIAANIASDPTLGVFVATNRRPQNLRRASFLDLPDPKLTYGVAYKRVEVTTEGVSTAGPDLAFQQATKRDFHRYIAGLESKASRYPKHIVVFVHGFNQTPPQAMTTAVAIRSLLQFDGPLVLFMWPSVGKVRNYPTDRLRAETSDEAFASLLCDLVQGTANTKVSVIAHSMGNYLVANALTDFRAQCPSAPKLNALVMLSPDLPNELWKVRAPKVVQLFASATAYVSEYDAAVRSSETFWDTDNFGFVHKGLPTVVPGVSSINVSSLQLDAFDLGSLGHDSYAYTQVMDDVFHLLVDGRADPSLRSTQVRALRRKDDGGVFYVMDASGRRAPTALSPPRTPP